MTLSQDSCDYIIRMDRLLTEKDILKARFGFWPDTVRSLRWNRGQPGP